MKALKTVLYASRITSNIFYLILFIWMLPYIYDASWQGLLFIGTTIIYVGLTLWTLLKKKPIFKETISYNLIMVAVFFYFLLVTLRVLFDPRLQSTLYTLNMEYCRNNFFLLSIILIGMSLNTVLLALIESDKEEVPQKKRPV